MSWPAELDRKHSQRGPGKLQKASMNISLLIATDENMPPVPDRPIAPMVIPVSVTMHLPVSMIPVVVRRSKTGTRKAAMWRGKDPRCNPGRTRRWTTQPGT
jgi:hypothetical protein